MGCVAVIFIMSVMFNDIYQGKKVLVTGAAGFKGTWLCLWLKRLGAQVAGYSLLPDTAERMADAVRLGERVDSLCIADIRDAARLQEYFAEQQPEIVFHLAAQPLVRLSYSEPLLTYETNVIGTLRVLEAARATASVRAFVNVTTDKCYENVEKAEGYTEDEPMGGYDMYSSSKGCSELLTASYRRSFLEGGKPFALASARAGNVIGGGDWSADRLIPDCIRAFRKGETVHIRNPHATRPWQHVLEPLSGYLKVGQKLMEDPVKYATSFNFGPHISANKTVFEVVSHLVKYYGKGKIVDASDPNAVHENTLLSLDVTKAYTMLQWEAKWGLREAVEKTVDWYKAALTTPDMYDFCVRQIIDHGEHLTH